MNLKESLVGGLGGVDQWCLGVVARATLMVFLVWRGDGSWNKGGERLWKGDGGYVVDLRLCVALAGG